MSIDFILFPKNKITTSYFLNFSICNMFVVKLARAVLQDLIFKSIDVFVTPFVW